MPAESENQHILRSAVESARNLTPSAFATAVDRMANIKDRWSAFDKIYSFVVEELEKKGVQLEAPEFSKENLSEQQIQNIAERSKRHRVAAFLLTSAYGSDENARGAVIWEAENLVPTQPDPQTLRPPMTTQDQVILFEATKSLHSLVPEDWECFFKAETEPVERRRNAFRRIYAMVGAVWREESLFARSITPDQRQSGVLRALMCYIPPDQWTGEDLRALHAELIPIEEPDWEALRRKVDNSIK